MEPFKPNQIRVMTANVAGQGWMGYPDRREVACRVYKDCKADVIGFQELSKRAMEDFKKTRPEMVFINGEDLGEIYVNPIAFREDMFIHKHSGTFWLSDDQTKKRGWDGSVRAATWAVLKDLRVEKEFIVLNFHPDNEGVIARTESVKLILEFLKENFPELPAVITADSNTCVDSPNQKIWGRPHRRKPYMLMIKAGFSDCWSETHLDLESGKPAPRPMTYHGGQGVDYSLDEYGIGDTEWILVRGFAAANCVVVRDSYGGIYPSDHFWLIAAIKFAK